VGGCGRHPSFGEEINKQRKIHTKAASRKR
jgi:hypothetical protein